MRTHKSLHSALKQSLEYQQKTQAVVHQVCVHGLHNYLSLPAPHTPAEHHVLPGDGVCTGTSLNHTTHNNHFPLGLITAKHYRFYIIHICTFYSKSSSK